MAVKCILTGQTPSVLDGVTENVQTQIDAKAADNAVVHLAGNETISGTKTFTGGVVMRGGADVASSGNAILNVEGVATDTDYIDMYVSGGSNDKRPLVLQNNRSGSGNVGIGTATPSEKLEVVGNVKATKFKGDGSELTNVPYPVTSVAGKTGAVTLAASDVGAQPKITVTGILQGDGNGNITAVESIGAEVVTLNKSDVGLGNVDNTSDANKPISNATQAALNNKQSKITANGILKGDGTGTITAADETEVELVDLPQEVFWATYRSTTYAEIKTAYDAQKVILVKDNMNNVYSLSAFQDNEFAFSVVKGATDFGTEVTTCYCSSSGWRGRYKSDYYIDSAIISLPAASWTGSDPYIQTIAALSGKRGVQANIQLSDTLYDQLVADGVVYLNIENNNGTFTAKAKGGKPSVDLTVQVSLIRGYFVVLLN